MEQHSRRKTIYNKWYGVWAKVFDKTLEDQAKYVGTLFLNYIIKMLKSIFFEEDKVVVELCTVDHIGDVDYDYMEYDIDTPIVDVLQRHK